MLRFFAALTLICLTACAAQEQPSPADEGLEAADALWSFETAAPDLRAKSCPEDVSFGRSAAFDLSAEPVALGPDDAVKDALPETVRFVGGWHLTAEDQNLGGLSGLDILPGGTLLAISDAGAFVWIAMEDGAPSGTAHIAYMRNAQGTFLSGKSSGDSEGLAYRDGLALVSYEHDHRILAFDLEGCGTQARGAVVAALPGRIDGKRIRANRGAEALTLKGEALGTGFETAIAGAAPFGLLKADGSFREERRIEMPGGYAFVGADGAAELLRAYDPVRGNRNIIRFGNTSFTLAPPLTVDNFEGIAVEEIAPDTDRIYIISDNNFSARQRTLLYAFDVTR